MLKICKRQRRDRGSGPDGCWDPVRHLLTDLSLDRAVGTRRTSTIRYGDRITRREGSFRFRFLSQEPRKSYLSPRYVLEFAEGDGILLARVFQRSRAILPGSICAGVSWETSPGRLCFSDTADTLANFCRGESPKVFSYDIDDVATQTYVECPECQAEFEEDLNDVADDAFATFSVHYLMLPYLLAEGDVGN